MRRFISRKHNPAAALALWLAALAGIWGCSETTRPASGPASDPGPRYADVIGTVLDTGNELLDTADTLITKTVYGTLGGTVDGGEVKLNFPAGALPLIHQVRVVQLHPGLPVWDLQIEPYAKFQEPVKLSIHYGDMDMGPEPYIVWFDEDRETWVKLESYIEAETRSVYVLLEHFSVYGVSDDRPGEGTSGWGKGGTKDRGRN